MSILTDVGWFGPKNARPEISPLFWNAGISNPMSLIARENSLLKSTVFAFALTTSCAVADEVYTLTTGETVAPLEMFQECAHCPEMIVMPLGSFMMGAIEGESDNSWKIFGPDAPGGQFGPDETIIIPQEHPRHAVEIDIPFAMGRNEVTIGEWMHCVEAGACSAVPAMEAFTLQPGRYETIWREVLVPMGPDHPATEISFLEMQEYIAWLNAEVGAEVYRLPTEAEWEYAARAGTETRFAQGDMLTPEQANYHGVLTARMLGHDPAALATRQMPVEVHELDAANNWGLRHMSGNVLEITQSAFAYEHLGLATNNAYLEHALMNRDGWRVAKGGAFRSGMDTSRLAFRDRVRLGYARPFLGFRILRQLD